MLYGIVFFQVYLFFTNEAIDKTSLRVLVAVLWILDTLQLALLGHATYYFLILNYARPETLAFSVWSLDLEIVPSVIVTFTVRCFFTVRLWHLSRGNKILIGIIMAFALPQLGIGLGMCVTSFRVKKFSELPDYMGLLTVQMSSATVAEALITGSLLYYLNRSKEMGTGRVHSLINRVIVWTVRSALLTGVVGMAQVISWVSARRTLIFLPFHLILAKFYTCSMLAMLNGRPGLRQSFHEPTDTLSIAIHNSGHIPDEVGSRGTSHSPHRKTSVAARELQVT